MRFMLAITFILNASWCFAASGLVSGYGGSGYMGGKSRNKLGNGGYQFACDSDGLWLHFHAGKILFVSAPRTGSKSLKLRFQVPGWHTGYRGGVGWPITLQVCTVANRALGNVIPFCNHIPFCN